MDKLTDFIISKFLCGMQPNEITVRATCDQELNQFGFTFDGMWNVVTETINNYADKSYDKVYGGF